ncbi:prepilin peptidase [Pseudoalteromonas sp. T1lg76]|uniref:prepilin peptidase n=1 Tax=Pseudoalteromonas sp. T1lg76 TaxID=2077103 RepID=UPI0018F86576|nr:A24 family peptidase [Pseudoalteromonas sp. T1lg76]
MFSEVQSLMQAQPWFFYTTAFFVSLAIGSFLNVVIYRLPKMMQTQWQGECRLLLADELAQSDAQEPQGTFNLITPSSTCPKCKSKIKPWQNIPVLSWLLLGGKCANCKTPISVRYPAIELITALLGTVVAWQLGASELALLYIAVTWCLVALTFIDIDHMLLPDQITLPLVWLALLASVLGITIPPGEAIIGAAAGYLSLWSVYWLFKLVTGKEGMGYGDFKLMAVFGALLGWQALPLIILLSSIVGAVLGIILLTIQGRDKATPIPFGPYIAIAGWIAMLWGEQIQASYMSMLLG